MKLIPSLHIRTHRSHLQVICEYERSILQNANVRVAKDHIKHAHCPGVLSFEK